MRNGIVGMITLALMAGAIMLPNELPADCSPAVTSGALRIATCHKTEILGSGEYLCTMIVNEEQGIRQVEITSTMPVLPGQQCIVEETKGDGYLLVGMLVRCMIANGQRFTAPDRPGPEPTPAEESSEEQPIKQRRDRKLFGDESDAVNVSQR